MIIRSTNRRKKLHFTFDLPPGITKVRPALEILKEHPSKHFLLALAAEGLTPEETETAFKNYSWSEGLEAYYRYIGEHQTAPAVSHHSSIDLPATISENGVTLHLAIAPWGHHGLKEADIFGRVLLSCDTAYGASVIYPSFSEEV